MGSFQTKAESAPHADPPVVDNEIDSQSGYFLESVIDDLKRDWFQSENASKLRVFERLGGSIDMDPRYSIQFYTKIMEESHIQSALIINLLGGLIKIASLPILDLGNPIQPQSLSGNLQYLVASDLTAPVMRGIDWEGRPFVVFLFQFQGQKQVCSLIQGDAKVPLQWILGGPDCPWFPCLQPFEIDSIAYKYLDELIQSHNT